MPRVRNLSWLCADMTHADSLAIAHGLLARGCRHSGDRSLEIMAFS